jgi:hypothetical protein
MASLAFGEDSQPLDLSSGYLSELTLPTFLRLSDQQKDQAVPRFAESFFRCTLHTRGWWQMDI